MGHMKLSIRSGTAEPKVADNEQLELERDERENANRPKDAQAFLKCEVNSIISLVDKLIEYADDVRASDIHIDPLDTYVRIRLRVDGVLQSTFSVSKQIHPEIIARIKVISGLRTDEHNTPQDGRFRIVTSAKRPIDIRVSIVPTYYGENAVLRLLVDKAEHLSLETLGFSLADREKIGKAIKKPTGMILATGPTGSGKTTTLYSLIKLLNTEDISIITIEDPVEYSIEGIEQIQVNTRTNLTFASGLRSVLRQDPDIIMVGEVRDHETASLAVNTALTGHLVLSSLHTNDASTTLPRLLDMGIEPYLVGSTVSIAIGQRLVRKICTGCKTPYTLTPAEQARIAEVLPQAALGTGTYFKGKGCDVCAGSGYRGRIVVNEILIVDQQVREVILAKGSAADIKAKAIQNGMTTMLEDGFAKAKEGFTTVSEVLRVVHE